LIKGGFVELGEALKKAEVEFKRWHFEQIKNYINALDVAHHVTKLKMMLPQRGRLDQIGSKASRLKKLKGGRISM
jgi:hypothetical protein